MSSGEKSNLNKADNNEGNGPHASKPSRNPNATFKNEGKNATKHTSTIQDQMRTIKSVVSRLDKEQDALKRLKNLLDEAIDENVMFTCIKANGLFCGVHENNASSLILGARNKFCGSDGSIKLQDAICWPSCNSK